MKKHINKIILALVLVAALAIGLVIFFSCDDSSHEGAAMKYVDPKGNVTASVSPQLMSLFIAHANEKTFREFEMFYAMLGVEMTYDDYLKVMDISTPDPGQDGKEIVISQSVIEEAVNNGKSLLQAEYLADHVYNAGLTEKEKKDIETLINSYVEEYGSEEAFENVLSAYGTNIKSIKRFVTLYVKYQKLYECFYGEKGEFRATDEKVCEHFVDNYIIGSHIYLSFIGNVKDDGTYSVLTEQEKEEKRVLAQRIMTELQSGILDFDEAALTYGEDEYKNGYIMPVKGISQIDSDVRSSLKKLSSNETEMIENETGIYIVMRKETDREFCLKDASLAEKMRNEIHQADFPTQLETADGIKLDSDVIDQLDPKSISAIDIIAAFAPQLQ